MGKLFTALKRIPTRTSALVAVIAAAIIVPATLFAWGPVRDTYTIENPADHVTFNSITNNPNIGDERNFVGIREAGTTSLWKDDMSVQRGKEYTVRMYVHNNAASSLNLVARDVTARFTLPTATGKSIQVDGSVTSSNATPNMVYDHATFTSSENFNLAYLPGTLKFENNAFGAAGTALPESIFDQRGALLGYDRLDGNIPGCFQFAGYVSFKVKPQFAPEPTPNFSVNKQVRKDASGAAFTESVAVMPGDTVNYRIEVKNTGDGGISNVVVKDALPAGMTFVPGTVKLLNANNPGGAYIQDGDKIVTTGVNIGHYSPGSNALVIFNAKVAANAQLPVCGPNKLTNIASAKPDGQNPKEDGADVTVPKECLPEVKYTCDSLTVDKIERTKFKFTTATTQQNATFKRVTYVIRNEQGAEVDRKESTEKTLDYTRTQAGKYTVEALVTFTVNGQDKTVTSPNCKKPFEVKDEPVVPAYRCEGLAVEKIDRTNFKFTTTTVEQNATFKRVTYVIRNEQGAEVERKESTSKTLDYTRTVVGKYTVEALVTFTVDGQDKTVTDAKCKKPFEVLKENTPSISIEKKVDNVEHKTVGVNQEFTYQITVKNTGEVDLTNAAVLDKAPNGVTFLKASAGTITNNTWNHTIASLKIGQSVNFTITAKVPVYLAGKIVNTICVDTPQIPGGPDACDDASIDVPPTPVTPEVPAELPKTGSSDALLALIGAGSLIASVGYYVASRRSLIG